MRTRQAADSDQQRSRTDASDGHHAVRLFSTNDYLGLSAHPAVAAAAATAAARYGMGPRASALVAGYTNHVRRPCPPSLRRVCVCVCV